VIIILFVIGCLAVMTVFRAHSFTEPLERDDAYYAVVAREMLSGRFPFADLWANTPPGIHLLYAAAIKVMGYRELTVKMMGLFFSILTGLGLFALARRCGTVEGACFALLLFAMTSSDRWMQGNGTNCEVPLNTFITWGFYFIARQLDRRSFSDAAVAGLLIGFAGLVKTVALAPFLGGAVVLVLGAKELSRRDRLLRLAVYFVFGGIPWGTCMTVYALVGKLSYLWDCVFRFNLVYYAEGRWGSMPVYLAMYSDATRGTWAFWLVALIWAIRRAPWMGRRAELIGGVWFVSSLFAIAMPGKYWPHYYYLGLPPVLFIISILVNEMRRLAERRRAFALGAVLIAATVVVGQKQYDDYLSVEPEKLSRKKYGSPMFIEGRKLGRLLGKYVPKNEKIFNWGRESELYFYSKRRPATRYLVNYPLKVPELGWMVTDLVRQLEREKPALIIVSDEVPLPLRRFIEDEYEFCVKRWVFLIYTRRGLEMERLR